MSLQRRYPETGSQSLPLNGLNRLASDPNGHAYRPAKPLVRVRKLQSTETPSQQQSTNFQ